MVTGVVVVLVVLVLATAFGLYRRRTDGRMTAVHPVVVDLPTSDDSVYVSVHVATRGEHGGERMDQTVVGSDFGAVATFVQFSGPMCSGCGPTRRLLGEIADAYEGVVLVDIDCEERMDLVRQYAVMRTPTVLVLDGRGVIVKRATGVPRRSDVVTALGDLLEESP